MQLTERNDKKEAILLAASQVFGEKGYHAATVEAIAQQAKIGKGTIYQYFSSKAEIFKELHKWYLVSYFDSFTDVISQEDGFAENLTRLIGVLIDNIDSISSVFKKIMNDMPTDVISADEMATMEAFVESKMMLIQEQVEKGIAGGELRAVRVEVVMHFIIGMLTGTMHSIMRAQEITEEDKAYLKFELAEIILNGIAKRE